jgi:hypothetical protein
MMGVLVEHCRFRDRCAWVMLLVPLLLVLGMRRADAVKEEGGTTTFTPGIMTGACVCAGRPVV